MENNIEEAIKVMEHWIEYEKNNKEKINRADELINIQETILSAYKRVLKENEELQEDRNKFKKALGKRITYCNELEKDLFENGSNYVIPKQKVKDKIEELNKEIKSCTEIDAIFKIKQQQILQELLGDK